MGFWVVPKWQVGEGGEVRGNLAWNFCVRREATKVDLTAALFAL